MYHLLVLLLDAMNHNVLVLVLAGVRLTYSCAGMFLAMGICWRVLEIEGLGVMDSGYRAMAAGSMYSNPNPHNMGDLFPPGEVAQV